MPLSFQAYASGSAGNLYTVSDGDSTVLIECGLPVQKIKRALGFGLSRVAFALVTHGHQDHSRGVKGVMAAGVDVFMSRGAAEPLGLSGHRLRIVEPHKQFSDGPWTVMPFDVSHDADSPLGFLIAHKSGEKCLFATDTFYLKYTFRDLTIIAVEANYSLDILRENVAAGTIEPARKNRTMRSHMSLETLIDFLKANDLGRVREIWLIHLSDSNSDAERFRREVQEVTGKVVRVA